MIPSLETIISRLRLKHLRLLVALNTHGSLLKAAEQVALSQPGATKALQEIEAALGTTLFVRTNRGLEANALGHCAIRYARLITTDLANLREEMSGIQQGYGGRVSVGVIMGAVPYLTEVLTRLLEKRPSVSVQIVEDTSARLLHLLDGGRLDLAICRPSISERPELYESINVRDENLAVVGSTAHPLADVRRLELPDLANYPWVVYSANMPMRLLLEREFHEAGLQFPLNLMETTSLFATLAMLQRDPARVAVLSVDVAQFCTRFGLTRILPLELRSRSDPYFLVKRLDRTLSPVGQLLLQEFTSGAAMREMNSVAQLMAEGAA